MGPTILPESAPRTSPPFALASEHRQDRAQYSIPVAKDEVGSEAQDPDTPRGEIGITTLVVGTTGGLEVLAPVELDGQSPLGAEEIQDVIATRMLAPELEPSQTPSA